MISQHNLAPLAGSRKARKRVGRGDGSGHGNYSGRGAKGQKARAGGRVRPGFEGGQLPLIKRFPRQRGFTNIFRIEYTAVNVGDLGVFAAGTEVTPELMKERGLVRSLQQPVKVLAGGELKNSLVVKADRFSAAAKAKIEAAGGTAEEVGHAAPTE